MSEKEMTFFEELQWRGLVQDISSEELIDKLLLTLQHASAAAFSMLYMITII